MGYEETESKLRALAAQREADRWRDCPTPGCRLKAGHDGLHRFVPEVTRLREEVERLRSALREAATGLEWVAVRRAPRDLLAEVADEVRRYANIRAVAARAALEGGKR